MSSRRVCKALGFRCRLLIVDKCLRIFAIAPQRSQLVSWPKSNSWNSETKPKIETLIRWNWKHFKNICLPKLMLIRKWSSKNLNRKSWNKWAWLHQVHHTKDWQSKSRRRSARPTRCLDTFWTINSQFSSAKARYRPTIWTWSWHTNSKTISISRWLIRC